VAGGGIVQIETKYNIGDVVYGAGITGSTRRTTCPDCLGQKTWQCSTPAGETFVVPCGTCERGLGGALGYLESYGTDPRVETLTIGCVRIETDRRPDERVSYMCKETGIGSGTIHYEKKLFRTYEEAFEAAKDMAFEREAEIGARNAETSTRAKAKAPRRPR